jgi:hypothetical protein
MAPLALLKRTPGYVWASPNTVLGLLLGLLSFQVPRRAHGLVVFDGPPRGFTWALGRFRRSAITFGHVVLSGRPLAGSLLAHELHHVWQYQRLGPLYIPLYLVVWAVTGYRRHPFEMAARLAEREGSPSPPRPRRRVMGRASS